MHPFPNDNQVVYRPHPDETRRAVITRFMEEVGVKNLQDLLALSEANPSFFWGKIMDDLGWRWRKMPTAILDLDGGKPWPRWFPGGETNVVDQLFKRGSEDIALHVEDEDGTYKCLTAGQFRNEVMSVAQGFLDLGIRRGDRVAILLPMLKETPVTFLALAAIGAISVPIFSGYGIPAIVSRLRDAEVKVLVTADTFLRRRRRVPLLEIALESCRQVPSVETVVVVSRFGEKAPEGTLPWDALKSPRSLDEPVSLPSHHPLMIIYTSGTTGKPKGTVHTHTGFPVKAAQDLMHCFDLTPKDTLFWYTDMGWMMGPWSILGSGIIGSRLVIYEGTPDTPGPDRLWEIIEKTKTSVFGASPTVIRSLMAWGKEPVSSHDLSSLRILGSSGEPWDPKSWRWYFEVVGGGTRPIINYSGGTEISGGILGSYVTEPMKPCAFSGPIPGMAARVLSSNGEEVREGIGDLAIIAPWVGMTRGFWNDPEGYIKTYWSRVKDTWIHGDAVYLDRDGFWYVLGRSDDTINTAGKRVSPAEAEAAALTVPGVREAAAVGVPDELKGEVIVLFLSLEENARDRGNVEEEAAEAVETVLGKAFRPKRVFVVSELPRTRSGKIVRRAVRASYLHLEQGDLSTLENPQCLEEIAKLSY